MTIVDCSLEMSMYHSDKVALDKPSQDEMRGRRDAGRTRLDKGLERGGHELPKETASQGSYAMRTMVEDSDSDYDIDDGAYFAKDDLKNSNGEYLTPYQARHRVCSALKQDERLKEPAEIHRNCVRQTYPAGYHVDIPVYRIENSKDETGNSRANYYLASDDAWVKSDARGVTRWFKNIVGELNSGESDGIQMRRLVRLTKKFARSRSKWKNDAPSGICLTKLVVECFVASANGDDESLHETWEAISSRLDESLEIEHPVLVDKNLADEGDPKVAFFRDRLEEALKDLEVLEDSDCSKKKALQAWDKAFDTTFFSDQYFEESQKKRAAALGAGLLSPAVEAGSLTFPNRPIVPNKPAGYA